MADAGLLRHIRTGEIALDIANSQASGSPQLTACMADIGLLDDFPFGVVRVKIKSARVVGIWIEKKYS
jgi:hypothetical protein